MIQTIINGILLGGLYAIIGVGMSMIFGIMRLTNLSHGDLMILASYLSAVILSILGLHPLISLVLVIPIMFLVGFGVQASLLNRVLGKGMEPPLLITFGISIIIQNALLIIFTPDAKTLTSSLATKNIMVSDTLTIPVIYLLDFLVGMGVILALSQFLHRTYLGRAIRAASDNENVAKLMGINTKRIYDYALGIAMITAAVAGVLVGMTFTFYPHTGTQYLIIAFGVVVIGGLGNLAGTLLAGMILGLAQLLGAHFLGAGFQLLFGYIILLVVLAVRPQGIFAR
ncbi:MAG: branched-chain amino acid ABC transporter permease [Peptococcaceae bacterium]|nr:branched-chain amino acid ABC transporter permease [Peptococcaceae bacterium]